jgi:hypothetical protein
VLVLDDGFSWQGTRYRSLSAIARQITGTAWSGPLFFGVKPNRSATRRSSPGSARSGGVMVEVYNDVALRRCPITRSEAQAMIAEVKGARLLQGFSRTASGGPRGALGYPGARVVPRHAP